MQRAETLTNERDPFTGTWRFRADISTMGATVPREWTQQVLATEAAISATEQITHSSGGTLQISVEARFDDGFFPVMGSPLVDEIAYTRVDSQTITATARKGGKVSMTEIATISPDGATLTLELSFVMPNGQSKSARAIFERAAE